MFLFIFENIGASELLLIGIVAMIFLGPRKMPEMARKIGKIMSEFRNTTSEFKETWQREVNFDEEMKAIDLKALDAEAVARVDAIASPAPVDVPAAPTIKAIDPARFDHEAPARPKKAKKSKAKAETAAVADVNDKKNWL